MKPETNQSKNNHIDEIVEELRRIVGIRKIVLSAEVPPVASLTALLQAYEEAGYALDRRYSPVNVNVALDEIYLDLYHQVF